MQSVFRSSLGRRVSFFNPLRASVGFSPSLTTAIGFASSTSEGGEELVPFYDALTIPTERVHERRMEFLLNRIIIPVLDTKKDNYLGYQTNHELPPIEPLVPTLNMHLNNAGDPFIKGDLKTNTKAIERAVLRYCAELWYDAPRDDANPNDPDNFWGYVLNMGSTEGNLNALWNAREYMDDIEHNPTGAEPIVLLSKDAHYSLDKAASVLRLETSEKVETDMYSRVIVDEMVQKVRTFASQGRSIIAVLNMGTTFAGAYDDHTAVDLIQAAAAENDMPCWVHMDGALGGFIAPHIERAVQKGMVDMEGTQEGLQPPPHLGFDLNIQSTNASFYKWVGAPYPCGIFMTQNKYLRVADTPDYIGSPDTTLGGGRNAFAGLYMWYSLCLTDYQLEEEAVVECIEKAKYLTRKLEEMDESLGAPQLLPRRAPYSMSVTFNAPDSEDLLAKYSIPNEFNAEFNTDRSHIYTMKHVEYSLMDEFCADLETYFNVKN